MIITTSRDCPERAGCASKRRCHVENLAQPLDRTARVLPHTPPRARLRCVRLNDVEALKARVENGYLVMKVPTTLPEGEEVRLVVVDDDDMTAEGRAELAAALEEAERDIDAGRVVDEAEVWAKLRAIG